MTHATAPFIPGSGGSVVVFLEPTADGLAARVADPRRPAVLVTDQGLTRGDGIFETMTAVAGQEGHRIRKEDSHLERLAASAEALALPVPDAASWQRAAVAGLRAYAAGNPGRDAVVKLVATRGPEGAPGGGHYVRGTADTGSDGELTDHTTPAAAAEPAEALTGTYWVLVSPVSPGLVSAREKGLDVLLLDRGFDAGAAERAPWLLLGAKTLSYAVNMAAMRHAAAQGADDVIFVSSDGKVLEGPTSTVLMARRVPAAGGEGTTVELVTPLRSSGILPGTSQGTIFAAAQAAGWELGYGPLEPTDLLDADGVWLVSSVRGVAPVKSLDGITLDVDGELTGRLSAFLAQDLAPGHHGPLQGDLPDWGVPEGDLPA